MRPNPYLAGCDVLGADAGVLTDKATVRSVQEQLHALAQKTGDFAFDPGKIDGLVGPHTEAAVVAFNKAYGWPADGSSITQGTLFALKRPDVVDPAGYAAKQAGDAVVHEVSPPSTPSTVARKPSPQTDSKRKWLIAGGGVLAIGGVAAALAVGLRR